MCRKIVLAALLALLWLGYGPARAQAQAPGGSCNGGYSYQPAPSSYSAPFAYSAPPSYSFPPPSVYSMPSMPYANGGYSFAPPAPYSYPGPAPASYSAPAGYEFERSYRPSGRIRYERYRGEPLVGGGRVICGPNGQCYIVR